MRYLSLLIVLVVFSTTIAHGTSSNQNSQLKQTSLIGFTTPSQDAEIIQGDWQILTTQVIQNREILVNGSLFISAPNVVIQNTTLFVMGTLYVQASNLTIDLSAITAQYAYSGKECPCIGSGIILDNSADTVMLNSSKFFSYTQLFEINEGADNLNFQNNTFSNLYDSTFQILSSRNVTFNLNHFELVESYLPTLSLLSGSNFLFTNNTGYLSLELNGTNSKEGVIENVTIIHNSLQGGISVTAIKNSVINSNSIIALDLVPFKSGGHMIFVNVLHNHFSSKSDELSLYYSPTDGDNMTFSFNTIDGQAQFADILCNNPNEWRYDVPRYDLDFVNNDFKTGIINGPAISLDSLEYQTPDTIHIQSSCVTSAKYSINGSSFQNIQTNYISLSGLKTGTYFLKIITNTDGLFLDFNFTFSYTKLSVLPSTTSSNTQETKSSKSRISLQPGVSLAFIALIIYRRKLKANVITHSTMK